MSFIWVFCRHCWETFEPREPPAAVSLFGLNVSAQMFPLMLCLNVILLYVLLHSRPACMSHTYNHGLTLWLQNEAFLSSENIVLAQRHERRYLVLKHGASPCG